jgi:hypothetical protein
MDVRKLAMVAVTAMLVFAVSSCAEKPQEPGKPAAPASGEPAAAAPAAKAQTTCPIMGGAIDKAQYVDVGAYRIYACCPACLPKIQADPEAAIAAIRAKGEEPEQLTQ